VHRVLRRTRSAHRVAPGDASRLIEEVVEEPPGYVGGLAAYEGHRVVDVPGQLDGRGEGAAAGARQGHLMAGPV
jgi:hypothetical protein